VPEPPVSGHRFKRVTDRVTEIQDAPGTVFALITLNHVRLDPAAVHDDARQDA
jgi:hypothetical protein